MTTWKQFKDAVESQGVRDDTPIADICWEEECVPYVIPYGDGVQMSIANPRDLVEDDKDEEYAQDSDSRADAATRIAGYFKRFYYEGSDGFIRHGCYLADRDLSFYSNGQVLGRPPHKTIVWIDEPPAWAREENHESA